jgi:hypothetical protein
MKTKFKILYPLLGLILLFSACSPNKYELGTLLNKSELKFTVAPVASSPNNIVLTSLTPHASPMWITPYQRSYKLNDTINLPFPGTYKIVYGAETDGGFVQADTTTIVIPTTDPSLAKKIHNTMWTNLTGGLGNEKTWYLDLNASGVSKFWQGPLYFYGTNDSWLSVTDGKTVGGDSWNWCPSWSGNTWLCAAINYGSMTFNLKQGFNAYSDHTSTADGLKMGGKQTGSYGIDTVNHVIEFTNVTLIHPINYDANTTKSWSGQFKVLSLTANSMQIAVLRDPIISGQGADLDVFNFVSKAYYDAH